VMMVVVVPKLTAVLEETGAELPASTKIVIGISHFLTSYWWSLGIIFAAAFFFFRFLYRTESGRRMIDMAKLRLPVFGKLFRLIYIVRFTRSLNTLIVGGVTIAKSLDVISDIVGNAVYRDLIVRSKKAVEEGGSLSKVFMSSEEIPKMVPQMIVVGEKTGKLDMVLKRVTEFYSREIGNMLANLMTLLEPIVMIIMGVGVGLMVAAVLMPMYNLASQF